MSSEKKWVIITGASSGIGKALAFEFAAGGFNLFLTARNKETLDHVAAECVQKFNIETKIYIADLSDLSSIDNLIEVLLQTECQFHVLINNAGFVVKGLFVETDIEQELKMINLQLCAMVKLTKAILPQMIDRKDGRILNVASVYSFTPVPFQSIYSACKAFMMSFSTSLSNELAKTGVTVTTIYPGITQTEIRARAGVPERNKEAGMSAQTVARMAYNGTIKRKSKVVPGFLNRIFVLLAGHLPASTFAGIIRLINNFR